MRKTVGVGFWRLGAPFRGFSKGWEKMRLFDRIRGARRRAPPPRVFFVHIPKTGGISVEWVLRRRFHKEDICPLYWEEDYLAGPMELASYRVFMGHLPYYFSRFFGEPLLTVTMCRHPLTRALSAYRHILRDGSHLHHEMAVRTTRCLADFANHEELARHISNVQTRMLGRDFDMRALGQRVWRGEVSLGDARRSVIEQRRKAADENCFRRAVARLEELALVGLQEDGDAYFDALAHLLGQGERLAGPRRNRAPKGQWPRLRDLTKEDVRAVERANEFDLVLYERARKRWAETREVWQR